MLLPLAPCVSPLVPQCTVPVLSNTSSESKLYTSNTDLGKLSYLSCSKHNIITVPCAVPSQPSLLSPTAKNYVYPVAESPLSTFRPTLAPVAKPPVVTSFAFKYPSLLHHQLQLPSHLLPTYPQAPSRLFRNFFALTNTNRIVWMS